MPLGGSSSGNNRPRNSSGEVVRNGESLPEPPPLPNEPGVPLEWTESPGGRRHLSYPGQQKPMEEEVVDGDQQRDVDTKDDLKYGDDDSVTSTPQDETPVDAISDEGVIAEGVGIRTGNEPGKEDELLETMQAILVVLSQIKDEGIPITG